MAERPILFNAAMVRAVLAGTKTQTRRRMRDQVVAPGIVQMARPGYCEIINEHGIHIPGFSCPFGQPGDHLWVRESFWLDRDGVAYKADQESGSPWLEAGAHKAMKVGANGTPYVSNWGWRPSIHMPRAASRITLEVTGVRVERLQDISEKDAQAEGVAIPPTPAEYRDACGELVLPSRRTAREAYRVLWEQINGPESWAANPWVWVVEFKRLEVPACS